MDVRSLMPFGRGSIFSRSGDPFQALRREMDRLFDDFTRGGPPSLAADDGFLSPKVNVAETETGLEVTAELPGIDQKDISLDLSNGVLTLKAERKEEKEEKDEKKQYHLVERSYGTYLRRFSLPFEADSDKVAASFDKGVLKVVIPRSAKAAAEVRKIEIKGG
ncbi:MAG: Hsp20/alpha crystallin family protein [Acetobacteraceae bacterium]